MCEEVDQYPQQPYISVCNEERNTGRRSKAHALQLVLVKTLRTSTLANMRSNTRMRKLPGRQAHAQASWPTASLYRTEFRAPMGSAPGILNSPRSSQPK